MGDFFEERQKLIKQVEEFETQVRMNDKTIDDVDLLLSILSKLDELIEHLKEKSME
jgi:hypothetical protein